jgi:hypothetical protein
MSSNSALVYSPFSDIRISFPRDELGERSYRERSALGLAEVTLIAGF